MYTDRPKPQGDKSLFEKLFDLLGILSFIAIILYLFLSWTSMPERIPIHFNAAGDADGWGGRWSVIILPIIGLLMWIGLHFVEKYPQIHNYIWFNEVNAQRQYRNSQQMLNVMKNVLLILFSVLTIGIIETARGNNSVLGIWVLPIILISLFIPMGIFIYRSYKLR